MGVPFIRLAAHGLQDTLRVACRILVNGCEQIPPVHGFVHGPDFNPLWSRAIGENVDHCPQTARHGKCIVNSGRVALGVEVRRRRALHGRSLMNTCPPQECRTSVLVCMPPVPSVSGLPLGDQYSDRPVCTRQARGLSLQQEPSLAPSMPQEAVHPILEPQPPRLVAGTAQEPPQAPDTFRTLVSQVHHSQSQVAVQSRVAVARSRAARTQAAHRTLAVLVVLGTLRQVVRTYLRCHRAASTTPQQKKHHRSEQCPCQPTRTPTLTQSATRTARRRVALASRRGSD